MLADPNFADRLAHTGRNPRVLVIDDFVSLVEEILFLLDLMGIEAVGAHGLDEGMMALRLHGNIKVVLSDVRLPSGSGFDLHGRINADPDLSGRQLRYLFMSGEMQFSLPAMPCEIYTKPVDMTELIGRIRSILNEQPQS